MGISIYETIETYVSASISYLSNVEFIGLSDSSYLLVVHICLFLNLFYIVYLRGQ